jgi:dTDP-4-dehydrorhamnose 3,5-epimerase
MPCRNSLGPIKSFIVSFTPLKIPGSGILETAVFSDNRGSFEVFWEKEFLENAGINFIPANAHHSYNQHKKTLRGMHYQLAPFGQDKLVSCVNGAVFDVMVDMRKDSPTYMQWVAETLTASCGRSVFIPAGCAHGFVTLEPNTTIAYLISGQFNPAAAATVRWDDPAIGIDWPVLEGEFTISARDRDALFMHI